jgi:general stress protein YciG
MSSPTDDQIRNRAHQLWEIAGRPEGREDEFWHEAERELKASNAGKVGGGTSPDSEKSDTFLE